MPRDAIKSKSVRALVVDDHPLVRDGLRARLSDERTFAVVGECGTGSDAIVEAERLRPDVVFLDLNLPDMAGTDVCAAIVERSPDVAVIVISAFADEDAVRAAFNAGARAFIVKDAEDLNLTNVVEQVLAGEIVIDPRAAASLLVTLKPGGTPPVKLSNQELRILQLAAEGFTNREIGLRLYLSPHTVKEYLSNAMRKLNSKSRIAAVMEARRQGHIKF
jgi:DNA-binding NarL/FixJ family response regulator